MLLVSVIFRVLLVTFLAIMLSLLANLCVKGIGIDIKDIKQRTNPKFLFIAVIFNLLFILAVAVIVKFVDGKDIGVLKWGLNSEGILFSLCSILITLLLAFGFIGILHSRKIVTAKFVSKFVSKPSELLLKILGFSVLFVAALQEEVMFRGYMNMVLSVYGITCAMLLSALVFTLWHFITNKVNLFQTIDWFLGGIMLFYVYTVSGSLWVTAIVHFSRNFANVLVFNIAKDSSLVTFDKEISPKQKTIYTFALSIVIILFTYIFYGRIPLF